MSHKGEGRPLNIRGEDRGGGLLGKWDAFQVDPHPGVLQVQVRCRIKKANINLCFCIQEFVCLILLYSLVCESKN